MAEDENDDRPIESFEEWLQRYEAGNESARELFQQISNIAVCLSYDLVDKLRYWEKETLKLGDEEIDKRLPHMSEFLERLKQAYLSFADVDL